MPYLEDEDDADDGRLDPEGPEPEEMDEHEEPDLIPCPHCRKMITDEAERCHHCGEPVTEPPMSSRWSMGMVFVICLLIVFFVIVMVGIHW